LYDFQEAWLDQKDFGMTDVGFIIFEGSENEIRDCITFQVKMTNNLLSYSTKN